MFKYSRVNVNRSETAVHVIDVPPWEVPVLAAVHGDDRITVVGEIVVKKPFPSPEVEYDRLSTKYKTNLESGTDFVAEVYGVGQRGIQTLAAEIDKARQVARLAPVQTPEYDANDDPLKGLFDGPTASDTEAVEIEA